MLHNDQNKGASQTSEAIKSTDGEQVNQLQSD